MGLGLHGGGLGAARFFAKLGARVTVTDIKTRRELASSLAKLTKFRNITFHLGGHLKTDFQTADCIIKNPGVPEKSKFLKIAKKFGIPVLSDVEVFFKITPAPIIGVTGTKGKSTVTWLIGEFLRQGKIPAAIGGNIRKSVFDLLASAAKSKYIVLELSSFQLDALKSARISPKVAIITNVFPDHLNRYPSFGSYIASKSNIFKYQKKGDCIFVNARDKLLRKMVKKAPAQVHFFDPQKILKPFAEAINPRIPSYHLPNIAAAIAAARYLGAGDKGIKKVLAAFSGVPSRMELVKVVRGVEFINDTTATNPTAAERAMVFTKKRIGQRKLHVIAGGSDKNLPAGELTAAMTRHAFSIIFLPGRASAIMKSQIGGLNRPKKHGFPKKPLIFSAATMDRAVNIASRIAQNGDVVLLAPGAASFGLFKHEFDRGEKFVQAVRKLPKR